MAAFCQAAEALAVAKKCSFLFVSSIHIEFSVGNGQARPDCPCTVAGTIRLDAPAGIRFAAGVSPGRWMRAPRTMKLSERKPRHSCGGAVPVLADTGQAMGALASMAWMSCNGLILRRCLDDDGAGTGNRTMEA